MDARLAKTFRTQPIDLQLGFRNYVEEPGRGPDWGIRLQATFFIPK